MLGGCLARQARQPWLCLVLGISLGLFLGTFVQVEDRFELDQYTAAHGFKTGAAGAVYVRCVVLVQPANPKPHKFVSSIIDTYSKRCNRTLFFSTSDKLQRQFGDQAEIYTVENQIGSTAYSFFHRVAEFVQKQPLPTDMNNGTVNVWTIFVNEQNFVLAENLRALASSYSADEAVAFGRIHNYRSAFSFIFPFLDSNGFALDAGVVLSARALDLLVKPTCRPGWLTPFYSGRALLRCADRAQIAVVDPVDEEGYHLLMEDNLRQLFSTNKFGKKDRSFEDAGVKAGCCSDRLISVGRVGHRDLRVMEYVAYRIQVVA